MEENNVIIPCLPKKGIKGNRYLYNNETKLWNGRY